MLKFEKEFDRNDLAANIADRTGIPEDVVMDVLKAIPGVLADALVETSGRVDIHDLGVFRLETRAARKGRNFQTGEIVQIPEHTQVVFNAAPDLTYIIAERTGQFVD